MTLSVDRLKSLLSYDPLTGYFRWMVARGPARVGQIAGRVIDRGYRHIKIDGETYLAHRLAWFYVHGEWPKGDIDPPRRESR